ncbi:MAG TPA: glycosyltransferase family 4 protein [Acidiphilium sp.]|nr:glycosyltransferase family 4 protein [Acidiphilium sp.]
MPGRAGHLAYNHALISHWRAEGHHVTIFLTRPRINQLIAHHPGIPVLGPHLWSIGRHLIATEPRTLANLIRRALPHRPSAAPNRAILGAPITTKQTNWIARHLPASNSDASNPDASNPDALIIDTIFRAPLLDHPTLQGRKSILIAHDLFHRRHAALTLAGLSPRPEHLTRADEIALLNKASSIVAIQPDEAALIAEMCPERQVITVPMPAAATPRIPGTQRALASLVFLGSASLPNLDGLRWFLETIWPRLHARRPDITLDLVGDCALALNPLPPGIHRLGRVPNLAPTLHRASLAIAPLRAGSGLKIKLLDYARHGLTTIASPAALEGLAPDPASPFIPAATPQDFIRAILTNLATPRSDLRALAYITNHYGPAHIFAPLDALLTEP